MMLPVRLLWLTALLGIGSLALAPAAGVFKTRLSPVAMDATMRATVAGSGTVSARLTGSSLAVTGSFEGLLSPATAAQIRQSAVTGMRGPAVFDLKVTTATSGMIGGSLELTPQQIETLGKGRFYVQLQSEKAPEGNLWGWLLP